MISSPEFSRGCNVAAREVADPEKRMVGTSVKYSRGTSTGVYVPLQFSFKGSRREFAFYGLYKNAIFLYNIIESFLSWKKL